MPQTILWQQHSILQLTGLNNSGVWHTREYLINGLHRILMEEHPHLPLVYLIKEVKALPAIANQAPEP